MLTVRFRNKKSLIPYDIIYYIESSSRKLIIHTIDQDYSYYNRLDNVQEELPPDMFIRIHKSYLISKRYIDSYTNNEVMLTTGTSLPISSSYKKYVKEQLLKTDDSDVVSNNNNSVTGSIICISGTYKNSIIRMYSDKPILIGRDEHCDICYNLPFISRKHCTLIFRANTNMYEILDHSANGTYIVEPSSYNNDDNSIIVSNPITGGMPTELKPGTIIHFGDTEHLFRLV